MTTVHQTSQYVTSRYPTARDVFDDDDFQARPLKRLKNAVVALQKNAARAALAPAIQASVALTFPTEVAATTPATLLTDANEADLAHLADSLDQAQHDLAIQINALVLDVSVLYAAFLPAPAA